LEDNFAHLELLALALKCQITHISLLRGGDVKDEWLKYLSELRLQSLKLNRVSGFTGVGLKFLNPEQLSELKLEICWELTKKGVKQIQRFPALESLDVCMYSGEKGATPGVDQALVDLLPKLRLRKLHLSNQHTTQIPEELIYAALPPTLVEFDYYAPNATPIGLRGGERGSSLNRWRAHLFYPSPLDIERARAAVPFAYRASVTIRDSVAGLVDYVKKLVL
jgi:hypothetical protein